MDLSWLGLGDANTRWVLGATMLLGLSSGVLGSFALLRRRSLMGDALAHAALPGICVAYLLTGAKSTGLFLVGAAVAGVLGTLSISLITRYSKIKEDAAMALVLTVFFGVGIMLMTVIQKSPKGNQSGLDKFLFGQAASLVGSDVQLMVAITGGLCLLVFLFFKELKLLAFDAGFGAGLGLPMGLLDLLLNLMIVLAVVVGLQAVGVILMAAMLVTPAISARYWTDRLSVMVVLAGVCGAVSGALGTLVSQVGPKVPTGPLIVLSATAVFLVSLLLAPRRGLLAKAIRLLQVRRRVAREGLLRALYELAEEAGAAAAPSRVQALRRKGVTGSNTGLLPRLATEGLVTQSSEGWALTERGLQEAHALVREQRLFEVYLMHEAELGAHGVDRDGLSDSRFPEGLRYELERLLRTHGLEPALAPARALKGGA